MKKISQNLSRKFLTKSNVSKFLAVMFSIALVAGCADKQKYFDGANDRIDQTSAKMAAAKAEADKRAPTVVSSSDYYINTTPVKLSNLPGWMNHPVTLQADRLPMNILVKQLLVSTNVNARYDNTVESNRLVTMHYRGTVKGALETLSAQTRYFYTLDNGNSLSWSSFETKTFDVSFMPGASEYLVGQQSGGNSGLTSSQGSSGYGATGGGSGSAVQSDLNDSQYSNLKGELSIWDDMQKGLNALKSQEGKIMVSQATTTVTVHDHPTNVQSMARYIDEMNVKLSKQVAIKVEVLDVTLDDAFNEGINWDAVFHALDQSFTIGGNLANAANAAAATSTAGTTLGLSTFTIAGDQHATMLQALSQQGKVQVATKPQVVTMNNQVATIRITTDTAYIQSSSSTSTGGVGSNVVTSSIQPGVVTEGFTMYVLPKIQDKNIYMQISSTLTTLLALQKQDNAPTGVNLSKNHDENSQFVAIQTPVLSQKVFNQRSVVRDGNTLIIAGFKQLRDQTISNKMFGVAALGSTGAATRNIETLVLITPVILKE